MSLYDVYDILYSMPIEEFLTKDIVNKLMNYFKLLGYTVTKI